MDDRRSESRRHLIYYIRILHAHSGQLLGHLVNITPTGMALISEIPPVVNETYSVKMSMPKDYRGLMELKFKVRCIWTRIDQEELHLSGYEIFGLNDLEQAALTWLVKHFGFDT